MDLAADDRVRGRDHTSVVINSTPQGLQLQFVACRFAEQDHRVEFVWMCQTLFVEVVDSEHRNSQEYQ